MLPQVGSRYSFVLSMPDWPADRVAFRVPGDRFLPLVFTFIRPTARYHTPSYNITSGTTVSDAIFGFYFE